MPTKYNVEVDFGKLNLSPKMKWRWILYALLIIVNFNMLNSKLKL